MKKWIAALICMLMVAMTGSAFAGTLMNAWAADGSYVPSDHDFPGMYRGDADIMCHIDDAAVGRLLHYYYYLEGYSDFATEDFLWALYAWNDSDYALNQAVSLLYGDGAAYLLDSELCSWIEPAGGGGVTYEYYEFGVSNSSVGKVYSLLVCCHEETNGGFGFECRILDEMDLYSPDADDPSIDEYGDPTEWMGTPMGDLYVINCQEWVSLRERPDTQSRVIAQVPLGERVENAYLQGNGFVYCTYNGMEGYIAGYYLGIDPPATNASGGIRYMGSVEKIFCESDFFDRYPDYESFNGSDYSNSSSVPQMSMGDYLFSAGCEVFPVMNDAPAFLYAEATRDSIIIDDIDYGESVFVNGCLNNWYLCEYNGRYGWIESFHFNECNVPTYSDELYVDSSHYGPGTEHPTLSPYHENFLDDAPWYETVAKYDGVSVFAYPDSGSPHITFLPFRAYLQTCSYDDTFSYIRYNVYEGFVFNEDIDGDRVGKYLSDGEYLGVRRIVNCQKNVTLREYPNAQCRSLGLVPLGAYVNVYEYNDDFYSCYYEGNQGYIKCEYVE